MLCSVVYVSVVCTVCVRQVFVVLGRFVVRGLGVGFRELVLVLVLLAVVVLLLLVVV